jgi:malate dehydrogenase (quinone)
MSFGSRSTFAFPPERENFMSTNQSDVVLVGAGIMSATLAMLLKQLQPGLSIEILESLDSVAAESSAAWNNAGTGHAALCELNYTPQRPDGSVDCTKALEINESFEISRQFWSFLVQNGTLGSPKTFINPVPHMSFVRGTANIDYLRKRYEGLVGHHCFSMMEFSDDASQLASWLPLMMENRAPNEKVAATRVAGGADVDFGALTRLFLQDLAKSHDFSLHLNSRVTSLRREKNGRWKVEARGKDGSKRSVSAKFVFLGAGGGALPLLQMSGIQEGKGYGGFPVSGQFLRCDNPEIVERHFAKVYGRASVGAPPMSVPHLDTRVIEGKKSLLFGPYAGFSTRFLKNGSLFDLPRSLKPDNLMPMLVAGRDNMDLTAYLIGQVMQSPEDRLKALKEFVPTAAAEDWRLEIAGQRVQVIKRGTLQFGTEVVSSADGTVASLLGASPGASTAVPIMLQLLTRCFPNEMKSADWQTKLKRMVPSAGESLVKDSALFSRIRPWTDEMLGLKA